MGIMNPSKMPKAKTATRKDGDKFTMYKEGGSVSRVNEAGNYTKPGMRKSLGVKAGEKIPAKKLSAAAKAPGKLGQRARLAQTLKKMK